VGQDQLASIDASAIAAEKLGDSIYANPLLLGFCWQKGWIPLSRDSLIQALRLNAVQVERNLMAFEWGRAAAHDEKILHRPVNEHPVLFKSKQTLEQIVHIRETFLTRYQSARYAKNIAILLSKF